MKILAHRGYWKKRDEKNSVKSLREALSNGFGFESDVRDFCGKLVISHNPADSGCCELEFIMEELEKYNNDYCFAINIKSDGLKDLLITQLQMHKISNYFTFDMSVPQMIEYIQRGITVFTRQSEYERIPVFYEESAGVWVDSFNEFDWMTESLIDEHIQNGKTVCIVSPELHQKPYMRLWEALANMKINFDKLYLCTDMPDNAKKFFKDII